MGGINLPQIVFPTFHITNLNWWLFREQFQATTHDKPQLGVVDKMTYLQDALKGWPDIYVIQGLTETAESDGEAMQCFKDRYNRPIKLPTMSMSETSFNLLSSTSTIATVMTPLI